MKLSAQVAALTAGLVVATAAIIGAAGLVMTRNGLDDSIDRSIESAVGPLRNDVPAAEATCGIDNPKSRDRKPGGPRRRINREVLVQCLDATGSIMETSPVSGLPISNDDRRVAAGTLSSSATSIEFDDEHLRVVTIGVPGLGAVQAARSTDERDGILASLLKRIALVTLGAAIAASAAGAALARRLAHPIVALTNAAEEIDRSGNLDSAVMPAAAAGEETRRLTTAFTGMVGSLRASRDAQARLVQDAGHELRTPLTSIRTNVSLLRRADLPPERRDGILADLDSELRELTDITNELVSLAADGGRTETPVLIDVAELVETSTTRWSRRSNRTVSAHIDRSSDLVVFAGPVSLQRAVDNLVSNSVKFSAPETEVDIEVQRVGATVQIEVADRGPGIAPADLPRIFERFYRSDEARAVSGSGLGLSIVAEVARHAGGTVTAANRDGGGAVFTLTLPASTNR